MDWNSTIKGFKAYLQLERSLSENSIMAYIRDMKKLTQFLEEKEWKYSPNEITLEHLQAFIDWLYESEVSERSQARIISGIRAYYKFLLVENLLDHDPTDLLEGPKLSRKLPDVLSLDEIETIINAIDVSTPEGTRNRAIIETLYGCGLRVSELANLKISNLYFDVEFLRVVGKGNKERLIPVGTHAIKYIDIYRNQVRNHIEVKKGHEDILFLNRRGSKISRVMIFYIIKDLVKKSGIKKNISPHTFRHSFASHLVDRGANLSQVQDMLGHESITTTEIYTHLDRDYLRDTVMQFHPRYKP